jgi:biotin synthase-like enzyme
MALDEYRDSAQLRPAVWEGDSQAGANSIFYGPKLLTTANPDQDRDQRLMDRLGLVAMDGSH